MTALVSALALIMLGSLLILMALHLLLQKRMTPKRGEGSPKKLRARARAAALYLHPHTLSALTLMAPQSTRSARLLREYEQRQRMQKQRKLPKLKQLRVSPMRMRMIRTQLCPRSGPPRKRKLVLRARRNNSDTVSKVPFR
jgi:hypothetical protein